MESNISREGLIIPNQNLFLNDFLYFGLPFIWEETKEVKRDEC